MGDQLTAPAEAYAPDPGRVEQDLPNRMPAWLAYVIALVILFVIEELQAARQYSAQRAASRRPALPRDPAETPAAAIGSQSDPATARTRRGHNAAPEYTDFASARAALLEKLRQSDIDPAFLARLEALCIVPAPISPDIAATPAAPMSSPAEPMPSPLCVAKIRGGDLRKFASTRPRHVVSPTPWRQTARAGTGPPTGPPAISDDQSCYA